MTYAPWPRKRRGPANASGRRRSNARPRRVRARPARPAAGPAAPRPALDLPRQVHLAQQRCVAGVRDDPSQQRVAAQPLDAGVVVYRAVEPHERLVEVAEERVRLGDLVLLAIGRGEERGERGGGLGRAAFGVVAERQSERLPARIRLGPEFRDGSLDLPTREPQPPELVVY